MMPTLLLVILAISTTLGQNQRQQQTNFARQGNPSIHNNEQSLHNHHGHAVTNHPSTRVFTGDSGSSLAPHKSGSFGQPGLRSSSNFDDFNRDQLNRHSGSSPRGHKGPSQRSSSHSSSSLPNGPDRFPAKQHNSGGFAPFRQEKNQNRPGSRQQFGLSEFNTGNHNLPSLPHDLRHVPFNNQRTRHQSSGIPGRIPGGVSERIPSRIPARAVILTEDDLDEDTNFAFVAVPTSGRVGTSSGGSQFNGLSNQQFNRPGQLSEGNIGSTSGSFFSGRRHGSPVSHRFPLPNSGFPEIQVVQQHRPAVGRPTIVQIVREDDFEDPEPPEKPDRPVFLVDSFGRPVAQAKFEDSDRFDRPSFERRPIPNRFNPNESFDPHRRPVLLQVSQQPQLVHSFGGPSTERNFRDHLSSGFEQHNDRLQRPRQHVPSQNSPQSHFGNPVPGSSFSGVRPSSGRHN